MQFDGTEYGCLHCHAGSEHLVAEEFKRCNPEIRTIVPTKMRHRRVNGEIRQEKATLFPGYVFFSAPADFNAYRASKRMNIYKLLREMDGNWQLTGSDRLFVHELFEKDGLIGFSQAYFDEGNRIHIIDGYLKGREAQIVRVNKRAGTAQIRTEFDGKQFLLWLGYEVMDLVT